MLPYINITEMTTTSNKFKLIFISPLHITALVNLCFQKTGTDFDRYRDVWDRVLEMGLEIFQLRNIYNAEKIGWVIDSAISSRHNIAEDQDSSQLDNGTSIYLFQVKLAMILNFIVHGSNNFLVQYDEESAWYDA